jgi:HemY protein
MKDAAIAAIALVGGGLLAHLLLADPGHVAIRAGQRLFETTLPVFVLMLIGIYVLLRSLVAALTSRRRLAKLRAQRRRRRARADTQRGLLDLAAGNWRRSEELMTRSASDAESPVVNYLVAARAADLQDSVARRDNWLAHAQEVAPEERAPALVTLAEMQMRRGQHEAALATLEQLDASGDLNSRGLELMARLAQKLGRGELLRNLGPRLRNAKELPESQVNDLLAQAELEELRAAGARNDASAVEAAWNALPRSARRQPQAIVLHARALMDGGRHAEAERELRELIEETGDAAALRLYGELAPPDPLAPLERAETWLRKRPDDPDVLATCARLCLGAELIGKARTYLEASIARRPSAELSLLLADLHDQRGERALASQVLRDALGRAAGRRSGAPRARLRRR